MKRIFIILFVFIFFPSSLTAKSPFDRKQYPIPPSIKVSVLSSKSVVFPGEEFKLYVSVIIEEGWHIYSLSPFPESELLETKVLMDEHVFKEQGAWKEPNPILIQDGAIGRIVKGHKGNIEFSRTYLVPVELTNKKDFINGKLVVRSCDNQVCSLPQKLPFRSVVQVQKHPEGGKGQRKK